MSFSKTTEEVSELWEQIKDLLFYSPFVFF